MADSISRHALMKTTALALGGAAVCKPAIAAENKPRVYFTTDLSVKGLQRIYSQVNREMTGKIGIKLHTGEPNGANLLPVELVKGLQATIKNSTIVECNVLYGGRVPIPRRIARR